MIPVQSPFKPGLVLIVSQDLARYPEFTTSLLNLHVPQNTTWQWASGTSIEGNRNLAMSRIPNEAEWIYTIDDDHEFEPDTLMFLIQRMFSDERIDILQGLCHTRKPPYLPYAYRRNGEPDQLGWGYTNASWDELPISGISEWDAVGTGGMLIRRRVIDVMPYPWFEAGKTAKDAIGEDLYFCTKARQLGFRVWMDSDTRTGHITKAIGWPAVVNGEWHVGMDMGQGLKIAIPRQQWEHIKHDEIKVPVP